MYSMAAQNAIAREVRHDPQEMREKA